MSQAFRHKGKLAKWISHFVLSRKTPCWEIFGTSLLNLISIPKTCYKMAYHLSKEENGMMVNILKSGDKRNKKTINQDGFELKNVPMNNMSFSSLPPPKSAHPCIHVFILLWSGV